MSVDDVVKCASYGFAISHKANVIQIEKRNQKEPEALSTSNVPFPIPKDQWYRFEFYIREEGELDLHFINLSTGQGVIINAIDTTYNSFDRVAVHGGFHYYLDELKVELL